MSMENFNLPKNHFEDYDSCEEKQFHFEDFNVVFDANTVNILDRKTTELRLEQIADKIDKILGQENSNESEIDIFSFSNREKYEGFLKEKFPENFDNLKKDNAIFYQSADKIEKIIVNYTLIDSISKYSIEEIEKAGISLDEIKDILQSNILSSVAHEMTHLHPFFGGVGNTASLTKWEQEKVCVFIGEKVRTELGNKRFRQNIFKQAQEELKGAENINLENDGLNWSEDKEYENFFYPYLEKTHGLVKLQELWRMLFHEPKKALSIALEEVYKKDACEIERDFRYAMLSAEKYDDVENISQAD